MDTGKTTSWFWGGGEWDDGNTLEQDDCGFLIPAQNNAPLTDHTVLKRLEILSEIISSIWGLLFFTQWVNLSPSQRPACSDFFIP